MDLSIQLLLLDILINTLKHFSSKAMALLFEPWKPGKSLDEDHEK